MGTRWDRYLTLGWILGSFKILVILIIVSFKNLVASSDAYLSYFYNRRTYWINKSYPGSETASRSFGNIKGSICMVFKYNFLCLII